MLFIAQKSTANCQRNSTQPPGITINKYCLRISHRHSNRSSQNDFAQPVVNVDLNSSEYYRTISSDQSFDVPNSSFNCSATWISILIKKKNKNKNVISASTWNKIDTKKEWITYDRFPQWLLAKIKFSASFERTENKNWSELFVRVAENTCEKENNNRDSVYTA